MSIPPRLRKVRPSGEFKVEKRQILSALCMWGWVCGCQVESGAIPGSKKSSTQGEEKDKRPPNANQIPKGSGDGRENGTPQNVGNGGVQLNRLLLAEEVKGANCKDSGVKLAVLPLQGGDDKGNILFACRDFSKVTEDDPALPRPEVLKQRTWKEWCAPGGSVGEAKPLIDALVVLSAAGTCEAAEKALQERTTFELPSKGIVDLTPLALFKNARTLVLDQNGIRDVSPLGALVELESVSLLANKVRDLTPLAALSKLIRLDVRRNKIESAWPLRNASQLRFLYLSENPLEITDFKVK